MTLLRATRAAVVLRRWQDYHIFSYNSLHTVITSRLSSHHLGNSVSGRSVYSHRFSTWLNYRNDDRSNYHHSSHEETTSNSNLVWPFCAFVAVLVGNAIVRSANNAECASPEPSYNQPSERLQQTYEAGGQGQTSDESGEKVHTEPLPLQESVQKAIEQARDLCRRIKDETGSPGLVVAVSVDGKQVWAEGIGYADIENRVLCRPDTVMRIASISKSFTMTLVAQLVEEGKLDLHKPISEYVKSWPEKQYGGEKVDITTHQLVSNIAGIRHYNKDCGKKQTENKATKQKRNEEDKDKREEKPKPDLVEEMYLKKRFSSVDASLELFKDDPLCSRPGTEYLYSTHGWTLVSAVVEGASGKKFPGLCRKLFKDLGLHQTYLDEPGPLIYSRAKFYVKNDKGRLVNAPYVDNSYKWAGGGMLSTVQDLLKFGSVMLYAYQQDPNSVLPGYLKADTVRQMWTPVSKAKCDWDTGGGYGQGWGVIPERQTHGHCRQQQCYISHTGGAIGASSVLLILPLPGQSTSKQPPYGIVVSMIVNLPGIGLNKTALQIAQLFQNVISN